MKNRTEIKPSGDCNDGCSGNKHTCGRYPKTITETEKEYELTQSIEVYVMEMIKYLKDWAITDPELTLIIGNMRRMMREFYRDKTTQLLTELEQRVKGEIKEELSAKPADDLEKTVEWYKVTVLQKVVDIISEMKK